MIVAPPLWELGLCSFSPPSYEQPRPLLDKSPRRCMVPGYLNQPCSFFPMSLAQQLTDDMKTAMKAKDTVALNVVRGLKSAIKYAAIEKFGADGELPEVDAIAVVRKEVKKRQDSVASYEQGGRPDLAETEKAEIAVLEKYLPAAMSAEEVEKLVNSVILELGATSKKDMGNVMKVLNERAAGRVDNRTLSTEVGKRLQ